MKRINFSHPGGFPLTQDVLDYQQTMLLETLEMFYSHLFVPQSGKYILSGVKPIGLNVSDGWTLIDGELLRVTGGAGSFLELVENTTDLTFEDNSSNTVYTERYLRRTFNSTGNIHYSDFIRINGHSDVTHSDCTHLANRTYRYQLPIMCSSISLDATGNTTGGFVLNRIDPFDNIPDGHELTIKMGNASGMTYLSKNGVESNIRYNTAQTVYQGGVSSQILRPIFGANAFIGTLDNTGTGDGIGYDKNTHLVLKWSESESVWKEIYRGSNAIQSNSI